MKFLGVRLLAPSRDDVGGLRIPDADLLRFLGGEFDEVLDAEAAFEEFRPNAFERYRLGLAPFGRLSDKQLALACTPYQLTEIEKHISNGSVEALFRALNSVFPDPGGRDRTPLRQYPSAGEVFNRYERAHRQLDPELEEEQRELRGYPWGVKSKRSTVEAARERSEAKIWEAELERILHTPEFIRSQRPALFLKYVIEGMLKGMPLTQKSIAEALGLSDAHQVSTLRIRTRSLLDRVYEKYGVGDLRLDLPAGKYVAVDSRASQ